jgi:hypothetical protein
VRNAFALRVADAPTTTADPEATMGSVSVGSRPFVV